jgi:hypothetical protein
VRIGIFHSCTLRDEREHGCKIIYGKRRYYKRDQKALNRQQRPMEVWFLTFTMAGLMSRFFGEITQASTKKKMEWFY